MLTILITLTITPFTRPQAMNTTMPLSTRCPIQTTRLTSTGIRLGLFLFCFSFLLACSSTPSTQADNGMSAQTLYQNAQEELQATNYPKAIEWLEKVENRAAGTPLAQHATIQKAYAQYRSNELVAALSTLDRFIRLNPSYPALDYAFYLKGLINFNDNLGILGHLAGQDLSERDAKAAKESFQTFRELVIRFPDSVYAQEARERMSYTVNMLARYEVHVARFYYKKRAYVAAIQRAQVAINNYQQAPAIEDALAVLVQSYDALGLKSLRDDAERVLAQTYPHSPQLSQLNRALKPTSGASQTNTDTPAVEKTWWRFW
jgi:outer membrane protein assembly factor BamD